MDKVNKPSVRQTALDSNCIRVLKLGQFSI
jgi:hypothetical protein